jgi:hypothetical protein
LPSLRTDHPVDGDLESLLQMILDPRLGLDSVASIDTPDVKSHETHALLRTTDWKASRANAQNGLALIGLVEPTREAALRRELAEGGRRDGIAPYSRRDRDPPLPLMTRAALRLCR